MSSIYEDGTYLENNPAWHSGDSEWKASQIFQILRSNHQSPKTVVDVGCGAGGVVAELAKLMHETKFVGYEVSSQAIGLAKSNASDRVQFVLGDYFATQDQIFDSAVCADVFEHIDDYLGFLRNLSKIQKQVVFHVPLDLSLVSALFPSILIKTRKLVGHVHYFNKETAEATIRDCGFDIVESRITAGCLAFPEPGVKGRLFWIIRKVVYSMSPKFAAKILGGFSLIILAQSSTFNNK
ncbi:MAG: class I SAM-dependent methyltransferase [Acidimicrobiaceae bacterium]